MNPGDMNKDVNQVPKIPTMFSSFWRRRKNATTESKQAISSSEFEKDCEIIQPYGSSMKVPPKVMLSAPNGVVVDEPIAHLNSAIGYKNNELENDSKASGMPIQCFDENVRDAIRKFINCID